MKNKRVFVSGGAGVIGTALVELLLQEGADVFVGDLKPCPKEWLGKVKYRQGDLNEIKAEELLDFDPHLFFHLAATFERSEETYAFFAENFHHNIQLSHHLINCLKAAPSLQKVIFASSYLIYDPHLYQFDYVHPPVVLAENASIYPRNICGAAKLFHEIELRFLDHFLSEKVSFACARIFRVYGRLSQDIISRWVRKALLNETLSVYRPEGRFDYIFADDAAEGLFRLALANFSGVVNLGSGHAHSVKAVLDLLKQHFPDLKWDEGESNIPIEASQADMQLFQQITGWMPTHTIEKAIPKLIQFEKERLHHAPENRDFSVLVTSVSKKIPLLEVLRKATDKLGAFNYIHGSDCNHECIAQYAVDVFWQCPKLDELKIEEVIAFCKSQHVKAIIPTRNADLEFYAQHLAHLRQSGIGVMVSSSATIAQCLDKKSFALSALPIIPTYLSLDEFEASSYVVKERYGAGSINIGLNLSKTEALAFAQTLEHPIFQPFIKGVEWSVDVYRSRHGKVMGCVARQRNVVVQGESQVTTTAVYPALENLGEKAADALNLYGHAVLQIIEDEEGRFHIIECNPRFGGASTASVAVGLDSFYWFLLECLNQDIEEYPFMRSPKEIRQVRYPADWILPWS
jgi:carbamoyl-phosphate synthase large subunit